MIALSVLFLAYSACRFTLAGFHHATVTEECRRAHKTLNNFESAYIRRHCGVYRQLLVRASSRFYDNHFDMLTRQLAISRGKQAKLSAVNPDDICPGFVSYIMHFDPF
jgi:hypothetical protein